MNHDPSKLDGAQLLERVDVEMQKMIEAHIQIEMRMSITDLLSVVGAMQLACRHPAYMGPSKKRVEILISQLAHELRDYPALVELIRRGGLKEFDITDQEYQAFRLVRTGKKSPESDKS